MPQMRRIAIGYLMFAVVCLVALIFLVTAFCARAHDHGRPELDGWFKGLTSKGAGPCCDGSDQQGLSDVDWDVNDGHYRVRIDGVWIDVPDNMVLTTPNLAGRTMVWMYRSNGQPAVRCFMPGSMT